MKLILCSSTENIQIEISTDQFKRLREPYISTDKVIAIAAECSCDPALLINYVKDLKKSIREMLEIDGSCDYSDHL